MRNVMMARRSLRANAATLLSALVVGLGLVLYGPLIARDPFLGRDDLPNVAPFAHVHGLGDYLDARARGEIVDLAPVRDLSFAVDALIKRATGFSPFHLTNFILGLLCFVLARSLAEQASG